MKQLLLFLFLFTQSAYSQDFVEVDQLVRQYPRFSNPEDLATQIQKDFTTEKDKSRAIFTWLAKNFRYNLEEFYNPKPTIISFQYATEEEKNRKLQTIKDNIVNKAFRTKSGVCEEYAQSFKKVCDLLGIKAEVIKGYVRNSANEIGNVPLNTNHAFNAVKIDDQWLFLDATWAAGYEINGKWRLDFNDYFYDIPKEKIFKTHYPDDILWQLRIGRMTIEEFYNQPIFDQSFLKYNATILSPKNGIINTDTSSDIVIKIKNLSPSSLLFYNYSNQRYGKKPNIVFSKDFAKIKIPAPLNNSDLIIFINRKTALQYRVLAK